MGLDLAALEQTFRTNIQTLLGMPENSVRRANQFDPPPVGGQTTQFATVFVQEIGGMGWDQVSYQNASGGSGYGQGGEGQGGFGTGENTDVTETITGEHHFIASIQLFKGNALVQAKRLRMLLQSSVSVQTLLAAGIGLGKIGQIRNLSALVDSYFENRAQFDVDFYVVDSEAIDLPTYGTFEGTINSDVIPQIKFEAATED